MKFTVYARERWAERCPDMVPEIELLDLRKPSKAVLNILRKNRSNHDGNPRPPDNNEYFTTPSGALLVTCGGVIITVYTVKWIKRMQRVYARRARAVRAGHRDI